MPWKKWVIYIEYEDEKGTKRSKKLTFQSVVRRIIVGRSLKSASEGSLRGKLLRKAELPVDLELEVAEQLECILPKIDHGLKGRKSEIITTTILEEDHEDDEYGSDVFDEDIAGETSVDLEDLEDAFDNFLYKLDNLDEEDLDEITSAVKSGLKSWLNFGSSLSGRGGGPEKSISDSVSGHGPGSRLRVMFRSTTEDVPKFDEDMGPEVRSLKSNRSGRAAKALAELNKGDDRLTRKAEEKVAKITGDFCNWLQNLPPGEDQTVNNIPPEKIKSLFDSTNSSKLATSKVVEGLRAWAKFGAEISGATNSSIFSMATSQLAKTKVKNKFMKNVGKKKEEKRANRRRKAAANKVSPAAAEEPKVKLDHRQYGTWFLPPKMWEKRFQDLSDPKSIEVVKSRSRLAKTEKTTKVDTSSQRKKVKLRVKLRRDHYV